MKTFNKPDRADRLYVKKERLALFRALFVGRTDAYVIWNNGEIRAVQESLDNDVLQAHLAGEFRVGSYLTGEDGRTPYLVFDIDKRDREIVKKIVRRPRTEESLNMWNDRSLNLKSEVEGGFIPIS